MSQLFKGTGVALITPFKNGKVDFLSLERIIDHTLDGGVDFFVSLGTTGEATTLNVKECRQVLDFTIEKVAKRKPIVAGLFGDNDTARLIRDIQAFDFKGIDAIMSSSPSYNKPNQEGIFRHYQALAEVSPLPIIIYNVPGRTASNVTAETTLRLARSNEKFIAVKEASGDLVQAMKIIKGKPKDFLVLSGDDPLTLPMIGAGGDGVISVIANAFPEFATMTRAALIGDFETAQKINSKLLDIHPWLYIDGNPAGIKGALEFLELCSRDVRLPLAPISDGNFKKLIKSLKEAGY